MSDPIIRELLGGDRGAEVDSSTAVVLPSVNPTEEPHIFTDIFTQQTRIVSDSAEAQPEPTVPPQPGHHDQQERPDLNMADSAHLEAMPPSPPEHSNRSVASGQPLQERMPEQGASGTANLETWGTAQLYLFIQRATQQAERLYSELQQWCDEQQQQISALTEQRDQLITAQE